MANFTIVLLWKRDGRRNKFVIVIFFASIEVKSFFKLAIPGLFLFIFVFSIHLMENK